MGQSNSQRKMRHQGVELWELYEEERSGNQSSRNHSGNRSKNTRRGSGKDGRNESRGNNGYSRRNADIHRREREDGYNRSRRNIDHSEERVINVYSPTSGARSRQPARAGSRRESTSHNRRTARSGDASRISYIQPNPGNGERRRSPESVYRGNARPVQSIRRRRARRRRELLCKAAIVLFAVACLAMIYYATGQIYQMVYRGKADQKEDTLPAVAEQVFDEEPTVSLPGVEQDFLEVNEYSRPGTPLDKVNSIFVHYTANPGTSAAQNRSYFANLAQTHERSASAHLIIGYEGELIQCIPFDEQAYAVMTRNEDSISIECCYLSEDGSFTQATYDTLIRTLAWLLQEYNLSTEDILRHYDCGGKLCPLYYAENEGAWEQLRQDVADYMARSAQ